MREEKNDDGQIFTKNVEVFAADLTKNIKTDLFQTKDAQNGLKECSNGWHPFKQEFCI